MQQILLVFASFLSLVSSLLSLLPCSFMSSNLMNTNGSCSAHEQNSPFDIKGDLTELKRLPKLSCPANIHVSWLNREPFIYKNASSQNQSSPTGVFVDLLRASLSVCFKMNNSRPPRITFDAAPASSLNELHSKVYEQDNPDGASMIMPVNVDATGMYFGMLWAVPVLQSPGEVLLLDRERFELEEQAKVWGCMGSVWLAIALSVLLSVVAGVCMWALDTMWNPDEFPNSFGRGVSEGFWWAFVTMTTVGYGDRTPKSLFGRLFGVIWTVFGISLCSVMTATITTALTSVNVNNMEYDIMDKKIAVLNNDNHAITETVKHFGLPKVFDDYKSMRDALAKKEVDGIVMEANAGLYRLYNSDNQLHIGNVYKSLHYYGFAYWQGNPSHDYPSPFDSQVDNCLVNIFKYRSNDVEKMIEKHTKRHQRKIKGREVIGFFSMKLPLFKKIFIALSAVCGVIVVCAVLELLVHKSRTHSDKENIEAITEDSV